MAKDILNLRNLSKSDEAVLKKVLSQEEYKPNDIFIKINILFEKMGG